MSAWRHDRDQAAIHARLHYNRHRYYDTDAGQYISRDPLGLRAGLRVYGYVADAGVQSDPLGLSPKAGDGCGTSVGLSRQQRDQVATLRAGGELEVDTVEEARALLAAMPELRPATQGHLTPNPTGRIADGFGGSPGHLSRRTNQQERPQCTRSSGSRE